MQFFLDREAMLAMAANRATEYAENPPFPHVVLDDFLPVDVAEAVLAEFPGPDDVDWWAFDSEKERKLASRDEAVMGPVTRQVLSQLNSATAIDFLTCLTRVPGLVPDPHYLGGGLHQIRSGGYLEVHADFNLHPSTGLQRRLNVLLYLNHDWKDEYGGALQLWSGDMSRAEVVINPVFNRCVIFSTTSTAFHGHPEPLSCPEDRTRKSLALYYYSAPDPEVRRHNTLFQARESAEQPPVRRTRLAGSLRRWLPPVAYEALRARAHRRRSGS